MRMFCSLNFLQLNTKTENYLNFYILCVITELQCVFTFPRNTVYNCDNQNEKKFFSYFMDAPCETLLNS